MGIPQTVETVLQEHGMLHYLDEVLGACSGGRPPANRDAREAYDIVMRSPEWRRTLVNQATRPRKNPGAPVHFSRVKLRNLIEALENAGVDQLPDGANWVPRAGSTDDDDDQSVADLLHPVLSEALGGNVGLNADWCLSAWSLGQGAANRTPGQWYLLQEEDENAYDITEQTENGAGDDGSDLKDITGSMSAKGLLKWARAQYKKASPGMTLAALRKMGYSAAEAKKHLASHKGSLARDRATTARIARLPDQRGLAGDGGPRKNPAGGLDLITAKELTAYKKAFRDGGMSFNDGYNVPTYGMTKAFYNHLNAAVSELGGYPPDVKLADLNRFLDGEKVNFARWSGIGTSFRGLRLRGAARKNPTASSTPRAHRTSTSFDSYEFLISDSFLSALMNGDTSGLDDADIRKLEAFEKRAFKGPSGAVVGQGGQGHWTVLDHDAGFGRDEITGLLANRAKVAYMVPKRGRNV